MRSISKTVVGRDVAALVARDAFGADALVDFEELTDGWFNAAYALTLDDGRRVVLKVAPPPDVEVLTYEHDIMHAEVAALRLVGARTDAPVPEVLWFDDSCRRLPSALFVMPYVDGVSLETYRNDLTLAQQNAIDGQLGRHLRAINEIRGDAFGLLTPSARKHRTWRDAFIELWTALLADGERKSVALPVPYGELERAFARATDACDDVLEPCLVYWDLWDGNVFVDPETAEVCGLFDLERALWGDPLMEMQFAAHERKDAFMATYQPTQLDTPSGRIRRSAYDLYLHLVMSIEGSYRLYPDDWIGDYARSQLDADLSRLRAAL